MGEWMDATVSTTVLRRTAVDPPQMAKRTGLYGVCCPLQVVLSVFHRDWSVHAELDDL